MTRVATMGLTVALLLGLGGSARAAMNDGDVLGFVNLGVTFASAKNSGNALTGGGVNFLVERVTAGKPLTFGMSVGRIGFDEQETRESGAVVDASFSTYPVLINGKYWLGRRDGILFGYVGLGLGAHFSSLELKITETNGDVESDHEGKTSFAIGIPLGGALFISNSVFINLNYAFTYADDGVFKNDIVHAVVAGIGFRFQN